ncbi:MAG: pyridoxal-dependent decarboxylase [Phycisphaerales bacterium]|nr:pyridoxal-dependent decarboxylase [Phycisphaerales bacterium]
MDYKHWIAQTPMGQDSLGKGIEGVVDWAQSYLQSLETRDVSPAVEWGEVLAGLELNPPEQGIGVDEIGGLIQQADSEFVDRLVHWNSPRFFAFFPCSNSVPAILGELMSAVLNVNGMLWSTSPACTELEVRVMDWCAELFGLDDAFAFGRSTTGGGCIQGTASEAVLAALVAARRRCTKRGIDRSKVTVYTSDQAHSSVVKAAMVAGLADDADDRSRVRVLETDADLRIDPAVLERVMLEDIEAGLIPAMVVATIGSTSTGAVDPVGAIADVLDRLKVDEHRCWLHLDAAWAGAASVCPEFRGMMDGHERADSICINPHKWLLTNFDCDLFWVRDHRVLTDSMSIQPAYLKNKASETSEVVDYRDWHVPLGRKMRALKLWMVIRCFGADGLRSHIRGHVELAEMVERWVVDDPRVELACERMLGLVCLKVLGDADLTKRLVDEVNARGRVLITHSMVPIADDGAGGRQMCSIARVSVGSPGVGKGDIEVLCTEIKGWLDREVGTR